MKEDSLSAEDKSKLQRAESKRQKKATRAIQESRVQTIKPNGTEKSRTFIRVSKGRKRLWSRQYVMHRKSKVIMRAEVKEKE